MRLLNVRPADPASILPMPDRPLGFGRYEILPVAGRDVDADHPFWAQALRDGSVVEVLPEAAIPNSPEPAPAAVAAASQTPANKD